MTSSIKKLKNSQVELTVDLDKNDLLFYVSEVEKRLAQDMKMEGFRPGKAPKEFVKKKIGEDRLREGALHLAVETSMVEAMAKEKLDVIDQADFKIKENSKGKLVYQTTLLVFPEIKLGEYKNLSVQSHSVEVAPQEVEKVLQEIQKSRVVLKEVNRPAQLGDRVEIDFTVKDGAMVIEGGQSENHPVILGEGNFVPGFEAQIVGMKNGEKKLFSLPIPADYYQKTIAGKNLNFEVTLKKTEDRKLPKVDDDLAKAVGHFQNVGELEASVKQGLLSEKKEKEKDRARRAVLEKIAETTPVEIPDVLIERQLDAMVQGLDNELHQRGMELGPYLAHLKKTQDDLRKDWHKQAEYQVKASLITRAIAREENLGVSETEVEEELKAVLQQYLSGKEGTGPEALQNINPDELRNRIRNMLFSEKVFDFLEKQNLKSSK